MHNEKINTIKEELETIFTNIKTGQELENLKIAYMGKSGKITLLNSLIKDIPNEEKRDFGMKVNELKNIFNENYTKISIYEYGI